MTDLNFEIMEDWMDSNVYCNECENYEEDCGCCVADENIGTTWYGPGQCIRLPRVINRNNDCKWFEKYEKTS